MIETKETVITKVLSLIVLVFYVDNAIGFFVLILYIERFLKNNTDALTKNAENNFFSKNIFTS